MKYVEIYALQNDGTQKRVAVCSLKDSEVICEGEGQELITALNQEGIKNYSGDRMLFMKDGLKFLEQLEYNFDTGYLNATGIFESK